MCIFFVVKAPVLSCQFCFLVKLTTWNVCASLFSRLGEVPGVLYFDFFRYVASPTFDGALWIFQDLLYIPLSWLDPHRTQPQLTSPCRKLFSFLAPCGATLYLRGRGEL